MEFSQIAIPLGIAAVLGIIAKKLKQPLLVGYLFAGIILATFGLLGDPKLLEAMGKIGVTLLLFLVGLEMNIREVSTIGKVALFTGIGQIVFNFIVSASLGLIFGFGLIPSVYVGIAMTFSSTIIIVKLLSEKNDLDSLYGKIAVGFLLVQDMVAILILMFLTGLKNGGLGIASYGLIVAKAGILLAFVWILSKRFLPYIFERYVATSQELLFIVSCAWALGVASFVAGPLNLSFEVGGFVAGLALSNIPEHLEIASRTRPLRDFFLTIFFMSLGAGLLVTGFGKMIVPALIFSLLVLIGNPIILMIVMGLLRFKRRTFFLASVTVAQISEFSLIIMAMGQSLGHVGSSHVSLTVMVAALTMTVSTYLILGAEKIYTKIKSNLLIFERKATAEPEFIKEEELSDHVVLIGAGRAGKALLSLLAKRQIPYLIIDYDPKVYRNLEAEKKPVIFGDISDPEIQDVANINKARMVISTVTNLADNLTLLEHLKLFTKRPTRVLIASSRSDAIKLYEMGASYVILPEVLAGEHLRHILASHGIRGNWFEKAGKSHFDRLIIK